MLLIVLVDLVRLLLLVIGTASARTTTRGWFAINDIFTSHLFSAAVKKSDHEGVWSLRKYSCLRFEIEDNVIAFDRAAQSLCRAILDAVAAVGKEDECLLSGLTVLSALVHQPNESLNQKLFCHISVLSDVLFLHA